MSRVLRSHLRGPVVITVTAAELPELIEECWQDGRRPIIHGKPGIGKTAIAMQVAAQKGLPLWMLRLAQRDPTALTGFHMPDLAAGTMRYLPGEDWPAGPCVAFLDELNRAAVLTQNAAFEFIEFGRAGGRELAPGSVIIAAVNYATDGGGVQRMPSALGNRFRHFHLEVDVDAWCAWALNAGVHPLVRGYIRFRRAKGDSSALHEFDAQADAWPSPRTWEFVSDAVKRGITGRKLLVTAAGDVGEARALEFCAYAELYRSLPSIDAILLNPANAMVPDDVATQYAVSSALASVANEGNFGRVMAYMERMPAEYMAFAVKDATARPHTSPRCGCDGCTRVDALVNSADYTAAMVKHSAVFGG